MGKLNPNVSRLVATTVVFSAGAAACAYMAWTDVVSTRPLWVMITVLVALLGGMLFECYRTSRRKV